MSSSKTEETDGAQKEEKVDLDDLPF